MSAAFYIAAFVAIASTALVVTHRNAVHALLLFIISLISIAFAFYILGAPFVAALEVIIYAGAIMVMFLFVVMLLNLGRESKEQERAWTPLPVWLAPGVLCVLLLGTMLWVLLAGRPAETTPHRMVEPAEVGFALFGPYIWGVHIAALLLLAGLISASHLRRHERPGEAEEEAGGAS